MNESINADEWAHKRRLKPSELWHGTYLHAGERQEELHAGGSKDNIWESESEILQFADF